MTPPAVFLPGSIRWYHWALLVLVLLLAGIYARPAGLLNAWFADTLDPQEGSLRLAGLHEPVSVRRDALGIPVIEATNARDLAIATGYVMASDRYEQMLGFALLAQGRLAEMAGPVALDIDIYMRTLGLDQISRAQLAQMDAVTRGWLDAFAEGVNAWLSLHQGRLPLGLALSGYQPEPWEALNSQHVFTLLSLALGVNVHEELAFLAAAQQVGVQKAAWLFPVYPDEPLPHAEAAKLAGLDLAGLGQASLAGDVATVMAVQQRLRALGIATGKAASNNWAVAPARTAAGASIMANDTHLLLTHPPLWMLLQLRSPEYQAAGIAVAGIPGIVAGTNGALGWGMTMVMADSQDLFLEQLRTHEGQTQYRYQEAWHPVAERVERFAVLGGDTVERVIQSTRHGPLINAAVAPAAVNMMQPHFTGSRYGLALTQTMTQADNSLQGLIAIAGAKNLAAGLAAVEKIGFIHLNMILADRESIGWQVTGRYPRRKAGTGHLPSPGWTGDYDWDGFVATENHPRQINPPAGWLATANHRTLTDAGFQLSSSWYYPERFERIAQVLEATSDHRAEDSIRLQFDQTNLLVAKLQTRLRTPAFAQSLSQAIGALSPQRQKDAQEALAAILAFDGVMTPDSTGASFFGVFEYHLARLTFMDELGGEKGAAWKALVGVSGLTYSALQDHLLGREDSPFWDDAGTPAQETKADIFARALSQTTDYLQTRWGPDRSRWQWGRLHYYLWASPATEMQPFLPPAEQSVVQWLGRYLDRGPYPAGGDRNTVNVAGHYTGIDFKAWDIPAMRMVVDFSREEPLYLINSGGQSGNPASVHYADGISHWLAPGNRPMPMQADNLRRQYNRQLMLEPER